jgi:ATP-dependent Clp protease ATP-binding subunit ClpA
VSAQEQARRLRHDYIGTEHLLLGLLDERDGIAARALAALGVTEAAVNDRIAKLVPAGTAEPPGHIPFTPRAKKVLELALREALGLNHNYIGTEHIALGLVREGEGAAARVLAELGVDLAGLRQQVINLLPAASPAAERLSALLPEASPAVQTALQQARDRAGRSLIASHQLVLALLADPNSAARRALTDAGVDVDAALAALGDADVAGTTDETDQDRGRRTLRLRLDDGTLRVECTDPTLLDLALAAKLPADGLSGDTAPALGEVWAALHNVLKALAAASSPPTRPKSTRRKGRPRRTAE